MGLFDFFKNSDTIEKDEEAIEFIDTIIESSNVENDLKRIANRYQLDVKDLDFTIISYKTYYRFSESAKYKLLKEIDSEEILTYENLSNQEFSIRQKYKINIFKKLPNSSFPIRISLGTNSDFTKVIANIKRNPSVSYHDRLSSDILTEINKKKLKQGILIGLLDDELSDGINKITSHIMINKSLKEEMKIVVCKGIERIKEHKEYISLLFQDRKMEENRGVSLKDQTNLSTIKKDEAVLEVIKSQKGQDGRNCKGEFLPKTVDRKESDFKVEDISCSENIYSKDEGSKVVYYAKKDGYVIQNDNFFDISDDVAVDEISIKTTGSIRAGDKDIKVNVQSSDESIDAIGSGVELDTKEIKVKGNVANNAKLKADLVEIDGQTHQSSDIKGKKIKINLHRGTVEGDKVDINTLEGGKVIADEVFINTLSGGEVRAKKIFINRLISNANLYASELVEITQVDGSSNHINMDVRAQRDFDTILSNYEKELGILNHDIKKLNQELKSLKKKILSEKESVEEIKKRVMEIKSQKQKPPQTMINKLKEDKENKLIFNKKVANIKDLKISSDELTTKIKEFNGAIFDARVVANTPWKEYNEITFHIVEPAKEISRVMEEAESANNMGLKVTKDNEYIIANLDS